MYCIMPQEILVVEDEPAIAERSDKYLNRWRRNKMGHIGIGELVVIFLIVLLLFGTKRLPEIGSALGKAIKEFKRAAKDLPAGEADEEIKESSQRHEPKK